MTDVVADGGAVWQSRPPLDEVYPILYVDGIRLRIKDNGVVSIKVAYLAIGVDIDGRIASDLHGNRDGLGVMPSRRRV